MELVLAPMRLPPVEALEVEIVEHKGRGHPDTITDHLVERFSVSLCRFYVDRFGGVLHHNVDKGLLFGGSAAPRLGGGRVTAPMEVYLSGRATGLVGDLEVPLETLAVEGSRAWLRENLHALDSERHVIVHCLVRPGSGDLSALFARRDPTRPALANDTSIGVGYWPLSPLERTVLAVAERLNAPAGTGDRPALGEDLKVLGFRRGRRITLTVACATVDRFLPSLAEYAQLMGWIHEAARQAVSATTDAEVDIRVNAADDPAAGSVYLTVTGTSAEAGDDGQVGRGNRVNGLITPYRPMSLEAAAGKNPVSHVGKLYQIAAGRIGRAVVEAIDSVEAAECRLASRIGRPINDPPIVDVALRCHGSRPDDHRAAVEAVVTRELAALDTLWEEALAQGLKVC